MTKQLPSGAFLADIPFTDEMKLEIQELGYMGMSNAAITVVIGAKYNCSVEWHPIDNDLYMSYEPFTKDYGTPPILPSNHAEYQPFALVKAYMEKYPWRDAVEGSIVEATEGEGRLIE